MATWAIFLKADFNVPAMWVVGFEQQERSDVITSLCALAVNTVNEEPYAFPAGVHADSGAALNGEVLAGHLLHELRQLLSGRLGRGGVVEHRRPLVKFGRV